MENQTDTANIQEAAKAAAAWWAKFLRQREPIKHQAALQEEEQAFNFNLNFLSNLLRDKHPISDHQADEFEKALTENIIHCCQQHTHLWIDVDYHPDVLLREAASAAGFDAEMQFPVKTSMWINGDRVTVRQGYGASEQIVYPVASEIE